MLGDSDQVARLRLRAILGTALGKELFPCGANLPEQLSSTFPESDSATGPQRSATTETNDNVLYHSLRGFGKLNGFWERLPETVTRGRVDRPSPERAFRRVTTKNHALSEYRV
jgi:hypothetical protein